MGFWLGYGAAAAAQGAARARAEDRDPREGALEGLNDAAWLPIFIGGTIGWLIATSVVNHLLVEWLGLPAKNMATFGLASLMVVAPVFLGRILRAEWRREPSVSGELVHRDH